MTLDLRAWLDRADALGQLRRANGADWNLEMGILTELNAKRPRGPALLFDQIPGYPPDYRVLTGSMLTAERLAMTLRLPGRFTDRDLVQALRGKFAAWEAAAPRYPHRLVDAGPILENVLEGDEVDVLRLPVPKWHEGDGGRYLGTAAGVVTRDPDDGSLNVGCYRVMVHDGRTLGLLIDPGHHGRIHMMKYHARGQSCPVAISFGHDPLLFLAASTEVTFGLCELDYAGAIDGEPVEAIAGPHTGLPIPARSEIAIEGEVPPGETRLEGSFGESTGYYSDATPQPIIRVKRLMHRDDPIILGAPSGRPPYESSYRHSIVRSGMLHDALVKAGVPDVKAVWAHPSSTSRMLIVVSIRQRYPGHAIQAGTIASQFGASAYLGRFVIVVDDDVDPMNTDEVLWALCTRTDPEQDIQFIRRAWSGPLDPVLRRPTAGFNSRAIIDATRPWEWYDEFPKVVGATPEVREATRAKWRELFEA